MSKFNKVLKAIRKKVKLSSLLLLLLTFSVNSFAWFIYATKVDSSISARVKAWKVQFVAGEEEIEEYVNFSIPLMYPGMENYTDGITVSNSGETTAKVSYEILSVRIMDDVYTANGSTLTSQMLDSMLRNDYPFLITLGFTSGSVSSGGSGEFKLSASWAYESNDDDLDTYWGKLAYDYKEENPDSACIELTIKISAVQTPNS